MAARSDFEVPEMRQDFIRPDGEGLAYVLRRSDLIAPLEFEMRHCEVRVEVFWNLLDGSLDPASPLNGVTQIEKQQAEKRGSRLCIQRHGLQIPDRGLGPAPRNGPRRVPAGPSHPT